MIEQKIDALQVILTNELALSAIREVFDDVVDEAKPIIENENDGVIGQKYRAYDTSKKIISDAFSKLETLRKTTESKGVEKRHI